MNRERNRAGSRLPVLILIGLPLGVCAIGITGCSTLPTLEGRTVSTSLGGGPGTRLYDSLAPLTAPHPGLTGIHALDEGREAFAARVALAETAQRSLDVQYYIWHEDVAGMLLLDALRRAAERGVRVRLLLDDNNTKGMDPALAAFNAHPNVELRLFNPFPNRSARVWGYMRDFSRVNRRMHNKSFTADGVATIVGGRNIGDEYFGAGEEVGYIDLDVIAIGAAVPDVEKSFDEYWSSASSYPANRILPAVTPELIEKFDAQGLETGQGARAQGYMDAVRDAGIVHKMIAGQMDWEWAQARLVVDDPAKALDRAKRKDYLMSSLEHVIGSPKSELRLVSPYFVPTRAGVDGFASMRKRGVQISILTNALETTDVAAVHAGYAKWRKDLLLRGVKLWELRRTAVAAPLGGLSRRTKASRGSGYGSTGESHNASLHAKTFAVDREQVFVGSFNFDPRSAALNTEMGLVIRSTVLAGRVSRAFDDRIPAQAYEVELTPRGELQWVERQAQSETVYHKEPGTSGWRRFCVKVMSFLPIDWLL